MSHKGGEGGASACMARFEPWPSRPNRVDKRRVNLLHNGLEFFTFLIFGFDSFSALCHQYALLLVGLFFPITQSSKLPILALIGFCFLIFSCPRCPLLACHWNVVNPGAGETGPGKRQRGSSSLTGFQH